MRDFIVRDVIIGVFATALVAALFSYWFTIYEKRQETKAKREVLFKALHDELLSIGEKVQSYDVSKVHYRDPIRLSIPSQLLDGETLEYRTHATLIKALISLQVAIATYNDLVETVNLAQNIPGISDSAHAQIYQSMLQRHQRVLIARDEVLKYISP